jgi:hypothetical protein
MMPFKEPIFTNIELRELLHALWFDSYHLNQIETKEYILAKKIRDAVEEKIRKELEKPHASE